MKKFITLLLVFVMVMSLSVTSYAYDFNGFGDIDPPVYNHDVYPYAMFWRATTAVDAYFYAMPFPVMMEKQSVNNTILAQGSGTYLVFTYHKDTNMWTAEERTATEGAMITASGSYVRWSNFDIYRSNKGDVEANNGTLWLDGDENFMAVPLAEIIQGVTEEQLAKTLPALGGTTRILVLCGAGLMASLMVLSLFGKRSLIFRS